jgi:hypothetical protein
MAASIASDSSAVANFYRNMLGEDIQRAKELL